MDYSKKIYGFLNILSFKNNCVLKFDDIYKVCQNQANYYINNKISGKIVNIVRISNINTLETYYLKCMTEGLAKALGNHSVIVNGLLIDENIDAEIESAWAVYLLSIFGAAISGQVVTLSSTQKNLEYNFPQTF